MRPQSKALRNAISDLLRFGGGYDQITPPYSVPPGRLRQAQNWEIGINEGYDLIQGYERYDGRPSPSSAIYYIISITLTGAIAVGNTVTGVTSGATAVVVYIPSGSAYIVVTKIVGLFQSGEVLNVAAAPQATTTSTANANAASSNQLHWFFKNAAADAYRSDILPVPGSGPIIGLAFLNDIDYAFRLNAGGTAVDIYKSSAAGWVLVSLGLELSFTSGGTYEVLEGNTITGATSGATAVITRVLLQSGTWAAGTAAGKLIFATDTGTFQAENLNVGLNLNVATIAGDSSAITLLPGGRFSFDYYNFNSNGKRIYGADGVNRGFEFDGTVFSPITSGMTPDTPLLVKAHKNQLFFTFDGVIQHSGIAAPYTFTPISGAAELTTGDTITAFSTEGGSETGGALAIYSRNTIHFLYGSDSDDWNMVRYRDEVGARAYSVQQVATTYFLDDRGVTSLKAVQAFGNFAHSTISQLVQNWIIQRKTILTDSCIVRDKGQMRLFFSDKSALYITFQEGKLVGMMPCQFQDTVMVCYSLEGNDGAEVIKFGADDGYVHQQERGTSFDGDAIVSYIVTHYNHFRAPRVNKDYRDITLEISGSGYAEMQVGFSFGYGDTYLAQPIDLSQEVSFAETLWDAFTWDSFFWDGRTLTPTIIPMRGQGENLSIAIRTNSDYYPPIKISGALTHYFQRQQMRYSR